MNHALLVCPAGHWDSLDFEAWPTGERFEASLICDEDGCTERLEVDTVGYSRPDGSLIMTLRFEIAPVEKDAEQMFFEQFR